MSKSCLRIAGLMGKMFTRTLPNVGFFFSVLLFFFFFNKLCHLIISGGHASLGSLDYLFLEENELDHIPQGCTECSLPSNGHLFRSTLLQLL